MKRISHKLAALLTCCSLAMVALGSFSIYSLHFTAAKIRVAESKARVDGTLYQAIVQGKDVLSDVLPPPAYVIESYLTALQSAEATDKTEQASLSAKLNQLHKEFNDSYQHWSHDLPEGKLKEAFLKAGEPALKFYDIVDQQFLPCIAKGDQARAKEILKTSLSPEYDKQRAEIDKVVACATDLYAKQTKELQDLISTSENEVSTGIRTSTVLTVIAVLSITLAVAILGFLFSMSITKSLTLTAAKLRDGAGQVSSAASQVSAASQTLAEGSSEQASSLEETGASLEEMSSMTKRNAENARKANELAKEARTAADKGVGDMQTMAAAMEAIKVSSDDIAKIIKTIDEIAFQTNILALNAAVEAARAGEAGMGFAVVADEVRNLAQRCAQAAKETAGKIEGAITKTGQGVGITTKVAEALNEIVNKVRQVDELVTEVAGATSEQNQGITQINAAVGQMDKVTQSNAATAEESAAAAEELNSQAEVMKQSVAELLQLVGGKSETAKGKPAAYGRHTQPVYAGEPTAKRLVPAIHRNGNGNEHAAVAPITPAKRRNDIPMDGDFKDF